MNAARKLALFALALAITFGAGWGVGSAVGPFGSQPPVQHQNMEMGR